MFNIKSIRQNRGDAGNG